MHHIYIEDGNKMMRDTQLHLNPSMIEFVKNKVTRLLYYEYLALIQVVPKKGGMIVCKNNKEEDVPQRVHSGWRVCIDFRKLNSTTRNDHFPLPFIDHMLKRLVGHSLFFFLDSYSSYNQIVIVRRTKRI